MIEKNALKIFGIGAFGTAMLAAFLLLGNGGGSGVHFEFLVRLEDKVNTQVFCLNPVHEGRFMNRVFYEDDTFGMLCPVCGSSEYLYRKNNAITKKGHFITFKPEGWSWGTNERLYYGIMKIECTYEQAQELCSGIRNEQAEADIEIYRNAGNKNAEKLAKNRAMIDERPRKHVFDFETVLTSEQVNNWKDKDTYSNIVILSDLAEVE